MSKKRALPADFDDPPHSKKRKTEQTVSMVSNVTDNSDNNLNNDNGQNDVIFVVGIGDDTENINGDKALFAAHSEVLRSMLYGSMMESTNNRVIINDITIDAFKYIKDFCYYSYPQDPQNSKLTFDQVIDVLYGAQKYLMETLIKKCNEKLLSMDDIDTFYLILKNIGRYAPSTFESAMKIILNCAFVKKSIHEIINSHRIGEIKEFQIKAIAEVIDDEFVKYEFLKSYCKIMISQNSNNDVGNSWENIFEQTFIESINWPNITSEQLLDTIRSDEIISDTEMLDVIAGKLNALQIENKKLKQQNTMLTRFLVGISNSHATYTRPF